MYGTDEWVFGQLEDTFRLLPSHDGMRGVSPDLTYNRLEMVIKGGFESEWLGYSKNKDASNLVQLCVRIYEQPGGWLALGSPRKPSDMPVNFLTASG